MLIYVQIKPKNAIDFGCPDILKTIHETIVEFDSHSDPSLPNAVAQQLLTNKTKAYLVVDANGNEPTGNVLSFLSKIKARPLLEIWLVGEHKSLQQYCKSVGITLKVVDSLKAIKI